MFYYFLLLRKNALSDIFWFVTKYINYCWYYYRFFSLPLTQTPFEGLSIPFFPSSFSLTCLSSPSATANNHTCFFVNTFIFVLLWTKMSSVYIWKPHRILTFCSQLQFSVLYYYDFSNSLLLAVVILLLIQYTSRGQLN